jgi:hypothetical protein
MEMLCSDKRIRGKSMQLNDISRQQFSKIASRGLTGRMTLTDRGLGLGAGTLLAKLGGKALPFEADQERIWTLLSVAYGEEISQAVLGSLRRVAKHWQGGDRCLAAIHLPQMGLPGIGEDAAYRLSLAAELIDAGVAPRELARELGFDPPAGLVKYDPEQPRVPAGSGRESGQWTSGDAATGDAVGSPLTEGRSAGTDSSKVNNVPELPKDAIVVTRPDGTTIYDPDSLSPAKKLMAPPRANFQEVYAAGQKLASLPRWQHYDPISAALAQFGTYDFQRDKATNTYFSAYVDAANYAVGVFMAGAGYGVWETLNAAQAYAFAHSSNRFDYEAKVWTLIGWEDADRGAWRSK